MNIDYARAGKLKKLSASDVRVDDDSANFAVEPGEAVDPRRGRVGAAKFVRRVFP